MKSFLLLLLAKQVFWGIGCTKKESPKKVFVKDGYTGKLSYFSDEIVDLYMNADGNGDSKVIVTDVSGKAVDSFTAPVIRQRSDLEHRWKKGFDYKNPVGYHPKLPRGIYGVGGKVRMILKGERDGESEIVVVYPTNTRTAYNNAGGRSVYTKHPAMHLSFRRPGKVINDLTVNCLQNFHSMKDYRFKYISDLDLDDRLELKGAKILIIIGHSEYWTRKARENLEWFVESGGNLMMLSGNALWVQVRYNERRDQMICYKNKKKHDPLKHTPLWATKWFEKSLNYPIHKSTGSSWLFGGYPSRSLVDEFNGFRIVSENSPLLRGTGLKNGDILRLKSLEMDGMKTKGKKDFFGESGPDIDWKFAGAQQGELIGYEHVRRSPKLTKNAYGTFTVIRKSETGGLIINAAAREWCSSRRGIDHEKVKLITQNMIHALMKDEKIISSKL